MFIGRLVAANLIQVKGNTKRARRCNHPAVEAGKRDIGPMTPQELDRREVQYYATAMV